MCSLKRCCLNVVGAFFPAALFLSPAWGSLPPKPGTINYVEGHATVGGQALVEKSVGTIALAAEQSLATEEGRVEILLTPGIFFRVDDHSSVQMINPGLADTVLALQTGRAMVEVADILPENNVRISEDGASTQLLKAGLYDFEADRDLIRVFDGKALVQTGGRRIEVKSGHELNLKTAGKLKTQKFEKEAHVDDFYRWASLRSSYLADANVDAARTYGGGGGWSPGLWYGNGWYWDPSFDAYTFIPDDGIFYDPFGWGFYSPWLAWGAPGFGFGFGYGGYYGYGGYGGYGGYRGYPYYGGVGDHRHFGPGYHPQQTPNSRAFSGRTFASGGRTSASVGHAYSVGRGLGGSGFSRGGAFGSGGGFRGGSGSTPGGGFGGGGGFHGGGGGGGGFHGGGGGGGGFHGGGGGGHGR